MPQRAVRCTTTPLFIVRAERRSEHRGVASFQSVRRPSFDPSFAAIASAFDDRVLVLPEVDAGNRVVLAIVGPALSVTFSVLDQRARELEARWKLKARGWVAGLRRANTFGARFEL